MEEKDENCLMLIKLLDKDKPNTRRKALYKCSCGNECIKRTDHVNSGRTLSCGCLALEVRTTHGKSNTPEYTSWLSMKQRCLNPKAISYQYYGGRGITICERWLENFENFLEDMGEKPSEDLSIHRIDNDGNYCKENCRWATNEEQANVTSKNKIVDYDGKTKTYSQWQKEIGGCRSVITNRVNRYGWTQEEAVSTPVKNKEKIITFNGKSQSLKKWSAELNIDDSVLCKRIQKYGIEKALSMPAKRNNKKYEYLNNYYTIKELSQKFNLGYQFLYNQIVRNKKSVEDIIDGK